MALGTELPFLLALGLVVLGPRRLNTMLGQVARAKAEFDKASRDIKSQLAEELEEDEAHADKSDADSIERDSPSAGTG